MDPYSFYAAFEIASTRPSAHERSVSAHPPAAMAPAEPGPAPRNAPPPSSMHPTAPTGPFPAPLRFETIPNELLDPFHGLPSPKAPSEPVVRPEPKPVESIKPKAEATPAAKQTTSPVSSSIVRPQRWQLADAAGVVWYSEDRSQLERWVASRNAVRAVVPTQWATYGFSAGGCSGGQCGRR